MDKSKEVLTTGQVAKICQVAPRTVSKWFDNGQLRGYRIPGSKDRRIPLQQLIRFMKAHGIPLDNLETGQKRVLIVDEQADLTTLLKRVLEEAGRFEVMIAESAFEAGALTDEFRPHVLVIDVDLPGMDGRVLARYLTMHSDLQTTNLIGVSASMTELDRQMLLAQGFHATLAKPYHVRELLELIEEPQLALV